MAQPDFTLPDLDYKYRVLFGERVCELREDAALTVKQLAQRVNLPDSTIGKIERAEKAILDRATVMVLANSFQLTGLQRQEFFACAGLIVDEPQFAREALRENEAIMDFYANVQSPAYVQNALFDLHSTNAYMSEVYGMDFRLMSRYLFDSIGPNILRVLFDPDSGFDAKKNWIGAQTWHEYASSLVYIFRIRSMNLIGTERYQKVLSCLMQWPEFRQIWQNTGSPEYTLHFPIPVIFHPEGRARLQFVSMDATLCHLPMMQWQMTCYIPADDATRTAVAEAKKRLCVRQSEKELVAFNWTTREVVIGTTITTL